MEAASIDELIYDIATSGLKGSRPQFDIESQVSALKNGWNAVDKWIAATLCARKGVHLPTLCKMTWEYLENSGNEVRMRPIFVLTESFLRGLRLASFQKPTLPQRCAACEDLNLSQVSIKFSESLTKDTLFVAMRDIVRKISDSVINNRSLCLKLQVGKFCVKGKKIWFDFDTNAFAQEGLSIPSLPDIPTIQNLPKMKATASSSTLQQNSTSEKEEEKDQYESNPPSSHRSCVSESQYHPSNNENGNPSSSNHRAAVPLDTFQNHEDFKSALIGGGGGGGGADTCLEDAYGRFISNLEKDAQEIETMENQIEQHAVEAHKEADRLKHERQHQVDELQQFIKQQMNEKRTERELAEKESRKPLVVSSQAPILTRDAGVADVLGATPPPPAVDESTLTPRALMVHRMRSRITDGGIRGKTKGGPDRHHLLAILQGQIGAKESLARSRKASELEEERRYLEHVKAEMHLHSTYTRSSELTKQRDLLASWERDGHLKNLNKLKNLGPKAMRDYAKEVLNPVPPESDRYSNNGGSSSRREVGEYQHQPRETISAQNSSRRIGNMAVGYDPRSG